MPVSLIAVVPLPCVAAENDELAAVEQVGQLRRIDFGQLDAVHASASDWSAPDC